MSSQSLRDSLWLFLSCFRFPGILFSARGDQRFRAVCVCSAGSRSGGDGVWWVWWGIFFRAELFLYVWARFPSEGTADFRSKMGLGQVL